MSEKNVSFKRVLSYWDLIVFGLAFVGPTAPYAMFGIGTVKSAGHLSLVYLIAMVAMSFTAVSYGRMAAAFPQAGSTYTYSSKALNPVIGFFAGWGMILDYLLIPLLSVVFVSLTAQKLLPDVPYFVWVLLTSGGITAINLLGIRVTARANTILNLIMIASIFWFVAASINALGHGVGEGKILSIKPFFNAETFSFRAVMAATSIAVLSFLGFDGVSTLAEEAKNPERDIGRATVAVCLLAGVLFAIESYLGQMVWPDYEKFSPVETAFMDIGRRVGGSALFYYVSFVLVVAGIASSITGQASASRLLFGMGRDRLLPERLFGYIHPKWGTPAYSILLMGALQLAGAAFLDFEQVAELVNFGALVGFLLVNAAVVRHFYFRGGARGWRGLFLNLICPGAGFIISFYIWLNLSRLALGLGFGWMLAGLVYVAILTRGFRMKLADLKV